MKKILSMLAVLAMVSVGLVAGSVSASAHTPKVSADCSGWNVALTNYDPIKEAKPATTHTEYKWKKSGRYTDTVWSRTKPGTHWSWTGEKREVSDNNAQPRKVNTVTISIDGSVLSGPTDFGTTFNADGVWSETANHTVSVTVTSSDGIGAGTFTKSSTTCVTDVQVVEPVFTPGDCENLGTLVGVNTDDYTWERSGDDDAAVLTAAPTSNAVNLVGQTVFGPYDLSKTTGEACAGEKPKDKVVTTHTSDNPVCEDGKTVVVSHWTRTTTTYELVGNAWVGTDEVTKWDSREFVEQSVCPTPTETTPPVTETTPPVTETVTPTQTKTAVPVVRTTQPPAQRTLAYTGTSAWLYGGIGFALILAGGVLLYGRKLNLDRKH